MSHELWKDRDALDRRLAEYGLRLPEVDLPDLQHIMKELDDASQALRKPRPYSLEPMTVFRAPRR